MSETTIKLWCFVRGSISPFKVSIENNNDIDDLKETILNKIPNPNDVKAVQLTLWRVNIDQNQIMSTSIDDLLNDKLAIPGLTIGEAFPYTEGNSVRVIVEVPVPGGHNKISTYFFRLLSYSLIMPNT